MKEPVPSSTSFRNYFADILKDAGFDVRTWQLVTGMDPVLLAENPYYVIAFQVFDFWSDLVEAAKQIELALSEVIGKQTGTAKAWDAYLVLVCRTELRATEEFNQLSHLTYDTRNTRKIIRVGLGDSVTRLDEVAKPFVSLTKARSSAKGRDPLRILENKMIANGLDNTEVAKVKRLVAIFKERGNLTDV